MIDFIQNINTFLDLVKYKSINNFKLIEKVSASKIWRAIDALELELNTKLIERGNTESIALTNAGTMLYNRFLILNDKIQSKPDGEPLYILCGSPMLIRMIDTHSEILFSENPPYNARFFSYTETFSRLCLNDISEHSIENYINGYDIVYLHHQINIPMFEDWVKIRTFKIKQVLCASKHYLKTHPEIKGLSDLTNHNFIAEKPLQSIALFSEKTQDITHTPVKSSIYSENFEVRSGQFS